MKDEIVKIEKVATDFYNIQILFIERFFEKLIFQLNEKKKSFIESMKISLSEFNRKIENDLARIDKKIEKIGKIQVTFNLTDILNNKAFEEFENIKVELNKEIKALQKEYKSVSLKPNYSFPYLFNSVAPNVDEFLNIKNIKSISELEEIINEFSRNDKKTYLQLNTSGNTLCNISELSNLSTNLKNPTDNTKYSNIFQENLINDKKKGSTSKENNSNKTVNPPSNPLNTGNNNLSNEYRIYSNSMNNNNKNSTKPISPPNLGN